MSGERQGAAAQLEHTWRDPQGFVGMLSAVNHKTISRRFMLATFGFFVAGGVLALLVRLQLARPSSTLIGADRYNQLFTMHGTTMMFLFAVPVMQAVALYLVPLMIGARSVAFPRMNAFAFWIFLFGGIMLYVAFFLDTGADAGWFAYVPLSSLQYSPSKRIDFWAQMITFTELSALMEAIVLITTILKMRAPGMTLNRMPLFVWGVLVTSVMVLFALPAVVLASTALITDRLVDTRFYVPEHGGDVLLWQHLFWFFGHPEVYLIFIPPLGFISSIIATFARRPVVGYRAMVLSLIATGFLSFGLWVHHMFATDLPELGKLFFTAASLLIALPTAVQIFCWIATLWSGRLWLRTPLLFVLGFFAILLLGGLTGLMLASVPLDLQLHDTYFVVAHLHYVLIGGAVFPLFGAVYYWFPKFTGRMLGERLGRWQFWLFFVSFNVAFFPMHVLGLQGMPRRVYTYPAETGWGALNLVSSIGALGVGVSVLLFVINVARSWRGGTPAGDDPWGAGTLEWSVPSPPPAGNFELAPVVRSRFPLWQKGGISDHVTGLSDNCREVLVTSVADASPDHRLRLPASSPWPLVAALAATVMFIGSVFSPWAVVWATPPVAAACTLWFWPRRDSGGQRSASGPAPAGALDVGRLPAFAFGIRSLMWWGTLGMIVVEGMVFALTIMSYFYLRSRSPAWPQDSLPPDLLWGTVNVLLMLASGVPNWWTKRAAERMDLRQVRLGMLVCVLFALVSLAVRVGEFNTLNVRWDANAYGSVVWMLMGLHTMHLLTDTYNTAVLALLMWTGPLEGKRFADVAENAGYWYFVVVSWLAVYAVVFWGARL